MQLAVLASLQTALAADHAPTPRWWAGSQVNPAGQRPEPPANNSPSKRSPGAPTASPYPVPSTTRAKGSNLVPNLVYDDPSDFYRGAGKSPREYSSRDVNANFEVYPFRETAGEVVGAFKASLLEDWIDRRFRVSHLVHEPEFSILNVPGADTAVMARFQDAPVGLPHERVRILILSGAHAAVIDIHALNTFCWNQIVPSMQRMFATLRIESTESAPSMKEGPGVEGRALAGLYRSTKSKYVVNLSRPVGFGSHVVALHYYLLTKDGRVHRCYDFPPGRDGTGQDFNFNAALGDDPVNTGTFTVRNKVLYIRMAKDTPENTIEGRVRADGALEIEGCVYLRQ